jgi:putative ABC transport system permease protein
VLDDLRFALRSFLKSPGFTVVAVLALALGVGANTAIFSVVYTLLLKPLPYANPDRLAVVWEFNIPRNRLNPSVAPANYLHWQDMNGVFSTMSAVSMTFRTAYTGGGEPEELPLQTVNASLFPMLGADAALGRVFTDAEDKPGQADVAVISDRLWRRRFNADPAIVNRTIRLSGSPVTVIGVMPPGFSILDKTVDVWMPIAFSAEARTPRGRWIRVVARLKNDVTFAQAQNDMTRVAAQLSTMFPAFDTGWTARVAPLKEQMIGNVRPALFVMLAAVGFVLLIACANVANLLLARATTRQRELAVRAALGADRRRIVRQLLAESLLLAGAGSAAGVALAGSGLTLLRTVVASTLPVPRLEDVALNGWVLLFALMLTGASALLFGIVPALTASGAPLTEGLKEGGRTGTGARGGRARQAFVVSEVALALVLLVGAGLLARSFRTLMRVDAGFDATRTVTMKVTLPNASYSAQPKIIAFFDRLFERIDAIPNVRSAGGVSFLPLNGLGAATSFTIEGRPAPPAGDQPGAEVKVVTHDYFTAMGIPLLRGRFFDGRDTAPNTRRIIVSESLVRKYFGDTDPIGQRIVLYWNDQGPDEIVGVVGDVRSVSLESTPAPASYLPPARFAYPFMTVVVKASAEGTAPVPSLVRAVRDLDPDVPVADIRTMSEVVADSTAERRVTMLMIVAFATIAMILAAVGIYGVIGYSVTQRTQEIGIRMALGAERGAVMRMVLAQAMTLTGIGLAAGACGAWVLTRLMQTLLFGVEPSDPLTFAGVAVLLAAIASAAATIPALRATRVDPATALRSA